MINPHASLPFPQRNWNKYEVIYASSGKPSARTEEFDVSDRPWFLHEVSTNPQAKCSWLDLLEDADLTEAQITLEETLTSADYVPDNYKRPLASADRKSFLTLMTLFRVGWENRGRGNHFVGVGDFCEVSVQNAPYYGNVFLYRRISREVPSSDIASRRYHLPSETARLAMFNCFDLGFAVIKTYDAEELERSLKDHKVLASLPDVVDRLIRIFREGNERCPGVAEAITSWAGGALWSVHNGNATPHKYNRLECSLSSNLLNHNLTVYI